MLRRSLLYDIEPEDESMCLANLPPDIPSAFTTYLKKSIDYFKTLDRTDILQEDYKEIVKLNSSNPNTSEYIDSCQEEVDAEFLRSVHVKAANTLDNFVQKTNVKKENTDFPQKRSVNLSDPSLKNKGVGKKKNVSTEYEEGKKNKIKESKNSEKRRKEKKRQKDKEDKETTM